jgi:ABC transport system ATP-binding/permease protein
MQNVSGENETVTINGKPRHIISYLRDFLFPADRVRVPVKVLSGGERNRLLLARLFTKPSNLLVMDEPTNDLDIETLELLEELLLEYSGTLLLVSHDRSFLNNVVTSTFALEGNGIINEYAGGYDDWLNQRKIIVVPEKPKTKVVKETVVREKPITQRKLSFKEERELERLPAGIEKLEAEQEELYALLADIHFYERDPKEIARTKARLETLEDELLRALERWEYLEGSKGG